MPAVVNAVMNLWVP